MIVMLRSSNERYGSIAITIHWLSALLIISLLVTGFRSVGTEDSIAKAAILRIHVTLGVLVLLITLLRLFWWLIIDNKPRHLEMPPWQKYSSTLVHTLFYVFILGMAASGIGMLYLSDASKIIFNSLGNSLPNFQELAPRLPHGFGARAIVVLLLMHLGAALYHHYYKADRLLKRMWFSAK